VTGVDRTNPSREEIPAEDAFGGIDVLVNNAGYGYRAAVEEGDAADVQRLFATNFFGPVALIKAALEAMTGSLRSEAEPLGIRAAEAIIEVVAAPRPPSLLLLGRDALATATAVLDAQRAEVEEWRALTASTDFED
jgi:NAD(P)-dependent dehydrogenase (short-subunit alcohol dehydrogenase family)